jgi:diguanylate cyclase (GGDEF)-like protein
VLPAWWQTWWARSLGIAFSVFVLYGTLRFRTYTLEKDRKRLEQAVAERSAELERLNQELREASLTDPLTGTRNRRFFQVTIEGDTRQAIRSYLMDKSAAGGRNRDLIFYIIDADLFKEVNDVYGHAAGDEMLSEMTRRIQSAIRMSDVLVRWGGEEFLVVSRYTERSEATTLASRILHMVGNEPFQLKHAGISVRRTCSIGWAAFPWFCAAPDAVSHEVVVELADQALYAAKQAGRNRAVGMLPRDADLGDGTQRLSPEQVRAIQITTPGPEVGQAASAGA